MKTEIALLTAAALLVGCSSVSDKSPRTIYIQEAAPIQTVQQASYVAPVVSAPIRTTASPKQAASVCETDAMRLKVVDGNDSNDSVRIMVVQDDVGSSQLLSEVEINCRDYYLRKSIQSSDPILIQSSAQTIQPESTVKRDNVSSRFTYIVQRGDTVWEIARQHCTNVKAISRLNGLGRGNVIDIGQRLKMPDQDCN